MGWARQFIFRETTEGDSEETNTARLVFWPGNILSALSILSRAVIYSRREQLEPSDVARREPKWNGLFLR